MYSREHQVLVKVRRKKGTHEKGHLQSTVGPAMPDSDWAEPQGWT